MNQHTADPWRPRAHVEERRARLLGRLGRAAMAVNSGGVPLPPERIEFLLREAEELYWNELAWEELTDEERVVGGHLTELVFPGLLAFVDALVQRRPGADGESAQGPHPEVVERILVFLSGRALSLAADLGRGADSERIVWARAMTSRLIDLILYRLHGLTDEERESLEEQ